MSDTKKIELVTIMAIPGSIIVTPKEIESFKEHGIDLIVLLSKIQSESRSKTYSGPLPNFDENPKELFCKPEQPTSGIAVDCGSVDGRNPGIFEYRLVDIATKRVISNVIIPGVSTNNIAEFLAIATGLMHVKSKHLDLPVYSDSQTALSWMKKRECRTKNPPSDLSQQRMIQIAVEFLQANPKLKALFWSSTEWGQICADYNRK